MEDFEKLGLFYLGKEYDLDAKRLEDRLVLYDSRDLLTHAVCVGMTGSGKTGLCIDLLEEAAIDGIPSLVIDPKGDLSNLLLTFPDLQPQDFQPWIVSNDAAGTTRDVAAGEANRWKEGLAQWGQDGARIRKLKESADFVIYTPGSQAGLPVSILHSFSAPDRKFLDHAELLREKISSTVTGLLNLIGIEATPMQSREHILLSVILDMSWKQGEDLDLAKFIQRIQKPPVAKIGVFDLESFFPEKDRFSLAMQMNNLLAAPGFETWFQGETLDVGQMLYSPAGKPRVCIFSIQHLSDRERMFFVTLLLTQTLAWVRTLPGSSTLRAILYMDEIFGYFPPVANPPSKEPLLTLIKQARAFGLGVVLATQNPVDLDYKALSNTGTWFIGRLQTERDRDRLLDGLELVQSGMQRSKLERILTLLQSRVFLLNNVHEEEPVIFHSRWALSYLRGPLTRDDIRKLMENKKVETPVAKPNAKLETAAAQSADQKPAVPPGISEFFLPPRIPSDGKLRYQPKILGSAKVYYADSKIGIALEKEVAFLIDAPKSSPSPDWDNAPPLDFSQIDLEKFPEEESSFNELPPAATNPKSFSVWSRSFQEWLYRNEKLELFKSPSLQKISMPGESERDFRIRLSQDAHEQRDKTVEKLRSRYEPKVHALQEKLRRAEQAVARETEQAQAQKYQTAVSFGTTLLGALFGRKKVSVSTLGRATTAARGVGRTMKESEDIKRAEQNVEVLRQQLQDLELRLKQETEDLLSSANPQNEKFESVIVRPKKTNISLQLFALVWCPYTTTEEGRLAEAW